MTTYIDRYVPGEQGLLVLFHGTGGDENQFIDLGAELAPGWALLGIRGQVNEHGALRYFRRFGEGNLDLGDLRQRTDEVAAHLRARLQEFGLKGRPVVALGYSNGANLVAGLLNRHPDLLAGAALWRPMNPLPRQEGHSLAGRAVLITASLADTITPPEGAAALAESLKESSAKVQLDWVPGGHGLTRQDVEATTTWLEAINS